MFTFLTYNGGTTYSQLQELRSADWAAADGFGSAVSVNGNVIAVGAYLNDDSGINSGTVSLDTYVQIFYMLFILCINFGVCAHL